MPGKSKIEWTDTIWNPITGCTKVSAGCLNCYAEMMTRRFQWDGPFVPWTVRAQRDSDEPAVYLHYDRLDIPSHWREPRRVFVNSMSDLFHEDVPFEFIDKVFWMMTQCSQHTFQVLTKRPERMVEFAEWYAKRPISPTTTEPFGWLTTWPSNVWAGVTVESSKNLHRLDVLARIPAPVRFVSCEPLLGPLDLTPYLGEGCRCEGPAYYAGVNHHFSCPASSVYPTIWWRRKLDWVVVGGESGHGARPMHPDWPRAIRDQCGEAGVPFFFKQHGEWIPFTQLTDQNFNPIGVKDANRRMHLWGDESDGDFSMLIGKKAAGALLDGQEHKEFPA